MRDEAVAVLPVRSRVRRGMRHSANWFQLVRFGLVGASGYVVNLAVFTFALNALDVGYRRAAAIAFVVAVTNNFLWNRHWTFDARGGHAGFQAARFFVVSFSAFLFSLGMLELLVSVVGLPEVLSQAIAIASATPLSFIGNKLWSFRA
jgi:dolichol-phosphate mannosyltransferase